MEVEVKQPEGYHLKAVVNDITDEGLDVAYDKGWRKPESVKFERCRAILADSGQKTTFKAGDVVDAYLRIDKNDKEEVYGWNKMKIRDIRTDFAVVESVDGVPITDIVPINHFRHTALPIQLSSTNIKSTSIPLNNDLFEYFSRSEDNYKVLLESIPSILIKLDHQAKELVVKAFTAAAIKKVEILKDAFLSNSRQKMLLLQRQEENKKMLSLHEPEVDAPFYVEFDVSTAFMGLAIGAQGANITNARALDGIAEVKLDETMREQGFCKFKIYAQNTEAAEQARNMLEFLQQQTMVPQSKVGQVIGKQGKTIQDIVDKSGVVRVQIGDENPEQGMVPFTFTGTREAINNAEMLVEFHLKHITEMDEIRAEEDEIRRKLFMSRSSPFQHYNGHQQQPQFHARPQNNNFRAANGGAGGGGWVRPQQDGGERRGGGGGGGGTYRGSGGQTNRYNRGGGAGSGRPFNKGARGGGQQGQGGQRFYRDQKQLRDQQNTNSSPPTGGQQESEDELVDDGSFNNEGPGSDGGQSTDGTNGKQQNSGGGAGQGQYRPPPRQQQMTGGFGAGNKRGGGGTRHQPAHNRRNKADEE